MGISNTIALPAQPDGTITEGFTEYVPLGGDGLVAPFAMYQSDWTTDADGTGGTIDLNINMDQQYTSLISFVTAMLHTGTPSDEELAFQVYAGVGAIGGNRSCKAQWRSTISAMTSEMSPEIAVTWVPPPLFLRGNSLLLTRSENVPSDQYELSIQVLLFDRDVLQKTPMNVLLSNLGGTYTSVGTLA